MGKNNLTAIIMATMVEAKPFVTGMFLDHIIKKPFSIFKKKKMLLVICGIGKANAAMATTYCHTKFKPDKIFNIGAAGALTRSKKQGRIYHINKIIEHDRLNLKTGTPFIHKPSIIHGFKYAILSTSDKAVISIDERKKVSECGGELVDMEGASIVQTCKKFNTPAYLFKYVSDTPEHVKKLNIIDNIRELRQTSFTFFMDHFKSNN